jgi:hypothetical protein
VPWGNFTFACGWARRGNAPAAGSPGDRELLAGRADMLVTENLKDFPLGLLELYPDAVLEALRRQASRYRREPRNVAALLGILSGPGQGCPEFAASAAPCYSHAQDALLSGQQ